MSFCRPVGLLFLLAISSTMGPDLVHCTEVSVASLATQLREIQDALQQRDVEDQQRRVHSTQLAEHLLALTSTMEQYVNLLEAGIWPQAEGPEVGSCTAQLALIQARLDSIEGKIDGLESRGEREEATRPSPLPSRPPRPAVSTSTCTNTLASIGSAQTLNSSANPWGFWGRDAIRNDARIYVGLGAFATQSFQEYANEQQLRDNIVHRVHNLSEPCRGTGHVIRDRHLFCGNGTAILKFDLDTDQVVAAKAIAEVTIHHTYQNGEGIDLSADDAWVWLVYALQASHSRVQLQKLNPETLETLEQYETHMPRRLIGQTFLVCGVLYSLDDYSQTPSYIKHVFNTRQETEHVLEEGDIQMASEFRSCWDNTRWPAYIAMLNYDPWEQALYAWNCGHLEKYPVQFAQQSAWLCRD